MRIGKVLFLLFLCLVGLLSIIIFYSLFKGFNDFSPDNSAAKGFFVLNDPNFSGVNGSVKETDKFVFSKNISSTKRLKGGGSGGSGGGGGSSSEEECNTNNDCSVRNLAATGSCNGPSDSNPYTWDYAPSETSICDLGVFKCTSPSYTFTHTCNTSCGAGCLEDEECGMRECDNLDGCYEGVYYDYQDKVMSCKGCVCETVLCDDFAMYPGDLRCGVAPSYCGDGIVDSDEVCDGANLNESTCVSQGYAAGDLHCLPNCLGFDLNSCTNNPVSDCVLITSSGNYGLVNDVIQDENVTCIEIHAEDVVLNCNGYSITTTSSESIAGIASLAANSKVINCNISGFIEGMAIYLSESDNTEISSNNFSSSELGISFENSDNVKISSNNIEEVTAAIWFGPGCSGGIVEENNIHEVALYGVINDDNCTDFLVWYNNFSNCNDAVHIGHNSSGANVFYNFIRNSSFGIGIYGANNVQIAGNVLSEGQWLIQATDGSNNTIRNNTISGSRNMAITARSGDYLTIEKNTLYSNSLGIMLSNSRATTVVQNNTIFNCEGGAVPIAISSAWSSGSVIRGNIIENCNRGISLDDYNEGIILENNKVTGCEYGLLHKGPNNLGAAVMTGNNFCGNSVDAWCVVSASIDSNKCSASSGCSGVCQACT